MNTFGSRLRALRRQCRDPLTGKALSQERVGGLLREKMGVGVSGATVSYWEQGASKIHADDRLLLVSLVNVLFECGGILSVTDANELLEAGNYRALNVEETLLAFPNMPFDPHAALPPTNQQADTRHGFFDIEKKWNTLVKTGEGPVPRSVQVVVAFLGLLFNNAAQVGGLRILPWIWIWLSACFLIAPSLHWPLTNGEGLMRIVGFYVAGTLVIPLLVGLLTPTKNNKFWMEKQLNNSPSLRLYTHQGASVGFHVGYFIAVGVILVRVFLRFPPMIWFEWLLVLAPLGMSFVGAREVPYSIWRAFGRMDVRDGGPFFFFFLMGPFWGFFLSQYSSLLTSSNGALLVLIAISLLVIGAKWRAYKK